MPGRTRHFYFQGAYWSLLKREFDAFVDYIGRCQNPCRSPPYSGTAQRRLSGTPSLGRVDTRRAPRRKPKLILNAACPNSRGTEGVPLAATARSSPSATVSSR